MPYRADNQGTDCKHCDTAGAVVEANVYAADDMHNTCLACATVIASEEEDVLIEVGSNPGREAYVAGTMVARLWLDRRPPLADILRSVAENDHYMRANSDLAKTEFARGLVTELREYLADRGDV